MFSGRSLGRPARDHCTTVFSLLGQHSMGCGGPPERRHGLQV